MNAQTGRSLLVGDPLAKEEIPARKVLRGRAPQEPVVVAPRARVRSAPQPVEAVRPLPRWPRPPWQGRDPGASYLPRDPAPLPMKAEARRAVRSPGSLARQSAGGVRTLSARGWDKWN